MPRDRRERSDRPEQLASILSRLAADRPLAAGIALGELGRRWADVVGERLSEECVPVGLDGGLLLVRVSSGAWAAQVRFLADEVRRRANGVLGADRVRGVRVTVGQ